MKINKIILCICLLLLTFSSNSQNFAPPGAVWNYSRYESVFFPNDYSRNISVEISEEIIISGKKCSRYDINTFDYCGGVSSIYLYSDSNKVYYYDDLYSSFNLLYDFNLNAGESYDIITNDPRDTFTVQIDSTDNMLINGNLLKVQYISTDGGSNSWWVDFHGKVIEKIGFEIFLFPQFSTCDPQVFGLRCYQDTSIGYYNSGLEANCDTNYSIFTSILDFENTKNQVYIHPNPFTEAVTISGEGIFNVEILDIAGKKLIDITIENIAVVNLSHLSNGLYFLNIKNSGKFHIKLIKQ